LMAAKGAYYHLYQSQFDLLQRGWSGDCLKYYGLYNKSCEKISQAIFLHKKILPSIMWVTKQHKKEGKTCLIIS
jgi:hypothetical protein